MIVTAPPAGRSLALTNARTLIFKARSLSVLFKVVIDG
jgi:hypothetical protein